MSAFLGFDACIDSIVKIVKEKSGNEVIEYFSDTNQFAEFLYKLENKSCGLELQTKISKIGGNMVITANALGKLNLSVECIGTFGLPDILPVFRTMSPNCSLTTIAETITATALEFDSSKVIMFDPGPYNHLTWEDVKNVLGLEKIKDLISGKQLVAFVNWSEIENSSQLWEGFLDEVLPLTDIKGARPLFFTDFSDCSRKSKKEIVLAINLLKRFQDYYKVVLSLNQNEAALIAKALDLPENTSDIDFISSLFDRCNSDILVIHRVKDAIAFNGKSYEAFDTFLCKEPMVLTGGGDNFNAGLCFALLNGFTLIESIVTANAVSGSYVKSGISPDIDCLIDFLNQQL